MKYLIILLIIEMNGKINCFINLKAISLKSTFNRFLYCV